MTCCFKQQPSDQHILTTARLVTAALLAKSLARTVPQAAASEHQCTLSRLQRPPVTPARVTAGICAMAAAQIHYDPSTRHQPNPIDRTLLRSV
jgi:hypothetical protein